MKNPSLFIRATLLIALFFSIHPGLRAESLFMRYKLPPLDRLQGKARKLWLNSLFYKRLQPLPVSFLQIKDIESADVLRTHLENNFRPSAPEKVIVFRGTNPLGAGKLSSKNSSRQHRGSDFSRTSCRHHPPDPFTNSPQGKEHPVNRPGFFGGLFL